jgi:hypothetical protein
MLDKMGLQRLFRLEAHPDCHRSPNTLPTDSSQMDAATRWFPHLLTVSRRLFFVKVFPGVLWVDYRLGSGLPGIPSLLGRFLACHYRNYGLVSEGDLNVGVLGA